MTHEEFIAYKRSTEKGNTYFCKAKELNDEQEMIVRKSFMNPQQFAIYLATNKTRGKKDLIFKNDAIKV